MRIEKMSYIKYQFSVVSDLLVESFGRILLPEKIYTNIKMKKEQFVVKPIHFSLYLELKMSNKIKA